MDKKIILEIRECYENDSKQDLKKILSNYKNKLLKEYKNHEEDLCKIDELFKWLKDDQNSLQIIYDLFFKNFKSVKINKNITTYKQNNIFLDELKEEINIFEKVFSGYSNNHNPESIVLHTDMFYFSKVNEFYSLHKETKIHYFLLNYCSPLTILLYQKKFRESKNKITVHGCIDPSYMKGYSKDKNKLSEFKRIQNITNKKSPILNEIIIPYYVNNEIWITTEKNKNLKLAKEIIESQKNIKLNKKFDEKQEFGKN